MKLSTPKIYYNGVSIMLLSMDEKTEKLLLFKDGIFDQTINIDGNFSNLENGHLYSCKAFANGYENSDSSNVVFTDYTSANSSIIDDLKIKLGSDFSSDEILAISDLSFKDNENEQFVALNLSADKILTYSSSDSTTIIAYK